MTNKKPLFLIATLWELIRFLLIFFTLLNGYRLFLIADGQVYYWLVVLGVGNLLLPAILLLLYFDQYADNLIRLARLGKGLALAASLLLIALEPFGSTSLDWSFLPITVSPILLLLALSFVDLIFLYLLLSYRRKLEPEVAPEPNLPDFHETEIPNQEE